MRLRSCISSKESPMILMLVAPNQRDSAKSPIFPYLSLQEMAANPFSDHAKHGWDPGTGGHSSGQI